LSRSGTLVYPVGAPPSRLSWYVARDSFVDVLPADKSYRDPRLSPDGRSIAFSAPNGVGSGNDISILTLATGTVRRLTSEGNQRNPEWSPDATHIAFLSGEARPSVWWQE